MERKDSWPAYQVECFREKYVLLDAHSPAEASGFESGITHCVPNL